MKRQPSEWEKVIANEATDKQLNTFLQRRQTHEKMLNITLYQRNANQNPNEVPFHASQNGCYPKVDIHSRCLRMVMLVSNFVKLKTPENMIDYSNTKYPMILLINVSYPLHMCHNLFRH